MQILQTCQDFLFALPLAEDEDFRDVSIVLNFPPGSGVQMECSAFAITDDAITEDEENFTISLTSDDLRIATTVDEATVTIEDNDGMHV